MTVNSRHEVIKERGWDGTDKGHRVRDLPLTLSGCRRPCKAVRVAVGQLRREQLELCVVDGKAQPEVAQQNEDPLPGLGSDARQRVLQAVPVDHSELVDR